MKCSCGHTLPDPVIACDGTATPPLVCACCAAVQTFTTPGDDILLTHLMPPESDLAMANRVRKPFGDRSPCPVCDEMMRSPIIEDGKATTESCGNCGPRRTIQVSDDSAPEPAPPDGKMWN